MFIFHLPIFRLPASVYIVSHDLTQTSTDTIALVFGDVKRGYDIYFHTLPRCVNFKRIRYGAGAYIENPVDVYGLLNELVDLALKHWALHIHHAIASYLIHVLETDPSPELINWLLPVAEKLAEKAPTKTDIEEAKEFIRVAHRLEKLLQQLNA